MISESFLNFGFKASWTKAHVAARAVAAAKHFFISLVIAVCITIPLIVWLYPAPYFQAAGGLHLLGMVVLIDLVIGPALTFLVFDRSKKSLKNDLIAIGIMQIIALAYGLYVTAASRPVFITYVVDRFEMVSAADVDPAEFVKAPTDLKLPRWGHPALAYAQQPDNIDERQTIMFSSLEGVDLNRLFRYYKPADLAKPMIVQRAQTIAKLAQFNPPEKVASLLKKYSNQPLAFVPVQGLKRDLTALVDSKTGQLIEVIDLRPWPATK